MEPRLAARSAEHGGVFTTADALACGYEAREIQRLVRAGAWTRLRRGVYAEAAACAGLTPVQRHVLELRGLMLVVSRGAVASHVSAAAVYGLDLLEPDLSVLHVTRTDLGASRTEAGVGHHAATLPAGHRHELGGLPLTSLGRAVVDLARTSTFEQGIVAADSALRAGLGGDELLAVHESCLTWPGARTAGRVVAFADGRSESVGESRARVLFVAEGLPLPELQQELFDAEGLIGRVDFLWRQQRTVGEFDGRVKYGTGSPGDRDALFLEKRREDRLRATGWEVVRMVWADLYRPAATAARFRRAFARGLGAHRPA